LKIQKAEIERILSSTEHLVIHKDEPLKNHSTYKIGGPADYFVIPETRDALIELIRTIKKQGIPYFIVGKGSNVLFSDKGFRGVVISLEKAANQIIQKGSCKIYVGAGVLLQDLVTYAEEHEIEGFDYLSGIPGTVGGALIMNAGAFVGEIGDRVIWVDVIEENGNLEIIYHNEIGFGYRKARELENKIVLGALLEGMKGQLEMLRENRMNYIQRRNQKQPLEFGSCGSVFKRPPGNYAGTLIEKAGCKGMRIGDAMVSTKHANFIVNLGNARASDVYELIKKVREIVYRKFGVLLEPEVKFVGEFEALPDLQKEKLNG
jgi:UDP-N-acetylmuramate dehydrogenase